ncbi:MAG TPA: ABC transporter permease, partial [Candidatus Eisenbacteria bacterium]|nr:ABC transporter permease [Candidatus Eisenbacteria bacterium]
MRLVESWIMDVRYSIRRLASRPAYVLLAVLTLALGTGGTAAILSIVRPLLLEPLPFPREAELGAFWHDGDWTEQEFLFLRPKFPGFQSVAAYVAADVTLDSPGDPLRLLSGVASSAELFEVLGTRPLLGRTFQAGDDMIGAEPVAVLSHRLWQDLGGEPSIIGRRLQLGGTTTTVVGVMPHGFWFPNPAVLIWTATPLSPDSRSGRYTLLGRIDRGSRMDGMAGSLGAIAASLKGRFQYIAQWDKTRSPSITPLREYLVGNVRPALLATLVAMFLILSMACVNVAALMLGQVGGRSTELAVRTALGAERRQIVQQIVIEALLIGLLAGAAGAVLATFGFQALIRALPLEALAETARLDWSLYAAATLVALLSALIIAIIPAVVVWRGNLSGSLAGTRTGGLTVRGGRLEGGLVVAQVALAVLLAAGAGLLLKSVANLRGIDPGLRVDRVAVIDAAMPTQLSMDERRQAVLELLPTLQALPDVRAAAATIKLPLRGPGNSWGIRIEGKPELEGSTTYFRIVSRDYFKTLGAPLRKGRDFLPSDGPTSERVVVINEALAVKYFPGEDPIGRVLFTGFPTGERVIGVVGNMAEANLTDGAEPARYMLYDQVPYSPNQVTYVLAATSADALPRLLQAGTTTLQRQGRQLALQRLATMDDVFESAVGAPGQVATLLSLLAGIALILGAVGVYGMISQFVRRRTRDYGIRMALGLPAKRVISHVMG